MFEFNTVLWDLHKSFPHRLPHVCSERRVGCFFLSIKLNICSTPVLTHMLSSLTSKLQSSAILQLCSSVLSLLPVRSRRKECLLLDFRAEAIPAPAPAISGTSLWKCASVSPNNKSCAAFRQCVLLLLVPFLFQAQTHLFQRSFTIFVSQLSCQSFRCGFDANFIFFPVCFVPSDERLVFLEEQRNLCE